MTALRRQSLTRPGTTLDASAESNAMRSVLQVDRPTMQILEKQQTLGNQAVQQRTFQCPLGNQTVQRLLRSRRIQAKLTINEPGDRYEQEADRVADEMMRMPDPGATKWAAAGQAQDVRIQRMCSECEEELHRHPMAEKGVVLGQIQTPRIQRACPECEEELHRHPIEEEEILQKEALGHTNQLTTEVEAGINTLRGGGRPLPESVRAFFEPRFGYDFSRVRIHTDTRAGESARAVNALAYTVESDVVFAPGRYAPATAEGHRLLAHELTHVVQQEGTNANAWTENSIGPVTRVYDAALQRWSYGSGAAPHPAYVEVPAADVPQIERAMGIVSRIVNNPRDFPACPRFFRANCPGGTDNTLMEVFNRVRLWKDTNPDPDSLASSIGADHVAYTMGSYGVGRWAVAGSMFHEFIHNCGLHGAFSHPVGDDAKAACGNLPDI